MPQMPTRCGDGGSATAPLDLTQLTLARIEYDSVGGMGEAYYAFEGRIWARWETDFPQAEQNLARRLGELTRMQLASAPARRRMNAPDLGDFPLLFHVGPGLYAVLPLKRPMRCERTSRTVALSGSTTFGVTRSGQTSSA